MTHPPNHPTTKLDLWGTLVEEEGTPQRGGFLDHHREDPLGRNLQVALPLGGEVEVRTMRMLEFKLT